MELSHKDEQVGCSLSLFQERFALLSGDDFSFLFYLIFMKEIIISIHRSARTIVTIQTNYSYYYFETEVNTQHDKLLTEHLSAFIPTNVSSLIQYHQNNCIN